MKVFFSPKGGCEAAIVALIRSAKKEVLVQAYSFTSTPIASALVAAHNKGIVVGVLLDRSWQTTAAKVEAMLTAAGVLVAIDGAHSIAHNKCMIVDMKTIENGSFNYTEQAELENAENVLIFTDTKIAAEYRSNWELHAAHSQPPAAAKQVVGEQFGSANFPRE